MKNLFKKAHKMTREMVNKYRVDYQAQFGLCLSYLFEEERGMGMVELKGTEKQVKWAEDIRDSMIKGLEELRENENLRYHFGRDIAIDEVNETIAEIKKIDSSKFFIENRYEKGTEIVILIENIKKAEEALAKIRNLKLTELEGSESQVNWAEKIRDEKLKRLAEIEDWRWNEYYYNHDKEKVIEVVATKIASAKTFIDTRDSLSSLVEEAIEIII